MKLAMTFLLLLGLAVSATVYAAEPPAEEGAGDETDVIMRWEGVVDGHDLLVLHGEHLTPVHLRYKEPTDVHVTIERPLATEKPEKLLVQKLKGRGTVEVLTQPSAENGYLAVIEMKDDQGGADEYSFTVSSIDSVLAAIEGRRILEWQGEIDGRDLLMLQGDKVMVCHLDANEPKVLMSKVVRPLPTDRPEHLQLWKIMGRGAVRLIQQPSEENNYLAIVEINDPEPGVSDYLFVLAGEAEEAGRNMNEDAVE